MANLAGPLVLDLGVPENTIIDDKLAAVVQWLRAHPNYFLILDNVDTEEAAATVEQKLAMFNNGHVVITSRITQWSESVVPLHLDVLSEQASTDFLLQATARQGCTGRIETPTDEAEARALAKDVDGLALALEQSAAYIRTRQITMASYRKSWAAFDQKVRGFVDSRLMKYPRSVLTTYETTFAQLSAEAMERLYYCGILARRRFRGTWWNR